MEEKVSLWKSNLNNGMIMGLLGVIYSLVMYFLDLSISKVPEYFFFAAQIVILFYMIKSYRDSHLYGFITYGQSLGVGVIIFLYYSIITAVFTYILYKFIDTSLIAKLLALTEETLGKRGLTQEQMGAAMMIQKKIMIPEILPVLGIIVSMFFGTIMSLIVSIFTRNEGNPLIDVPKN